MADEKTNEVISAVTDVNRVVEPIVAPADATL